MSIRPKSIFDAEFIYETNIDGDNVNRLQANGSKKLKTISYVILLKVLQKEMGYN